MTEAGNARNEASGLAIVADTGRATLACESALELEFVDPEQR